MDNVNNNLRGSGLVRSLPEPAELIGRDRNRHRKAQNVYRKVDQSKEPFTVKVSRKVHHAKERITRRLGLYGARHVFPLGMYVDYLA